MLLNVWERTAQPGALVFILKIPLIERVANKVTLKEQVVDFPPQPVITKDNVTMQIDTVVYYQITDPKALYLWVEMLMSAIENLDGYYTS